MISVKKYLWLLLVVGFLQCSEDKKPEGILDKQEMVNLLVDIYIGESKISMYRIPLDSAMQLFYPFEDAEMAKRNLSDSTLKANYKYYLQRPEQLEEILDAVIDTLNLREQRAIEQP